MSETEMMLAPASHSDPITDDRGHELACILAQGNQLLVDDEEAFLSKKAPRSASEVRIAALACLASIEEIFRAAQETGLPKFTSGYYLPLPLERLRSQLVDVEEGVRSMLLEPRPDGNHLNPRSYDRVVIEGEAVAALSVLMKDGEKRDIAANQIAKLLERVGFAKPNRDGGPYKGSAVIEWRERQRVIDQIRSTKDSLA
jgi:hypothetical protein